MQQYEYKVVPAPKRGEKAKGVRSTEDRFAHALQTLMNQEGAKGWEYQRTDTLPCEERVGLTGRATTFQNLLVFRRPLAETRAAAAPKLAGKQPVSVTSESQPEAPANTPKVDMTGPNAEGKAPPLGGVPKDDPGKTASAPDVAAQ